MGFSHQTFSAHVLKLRLKTPSDRSFSQTTLSQSDIPKVGGGCLMFSFCLEPDSFSCLLSCCSSALLSCFVLLPYCPVLFFLSGTSGLLPDSFSCLLSCCSSALLSCFVLLPYCPVLFFLSSPFSANGRRFHSTFFPKKILQQFSLRDRPFCMVLVVQLGNDNW